jgi:hypothetical protein
MSTTAIVPAHEVQVTEVTLSEPKVNKAGGKGVQLKYAGQPFQLRLPRTKFPAGLISREDAASGNVNYSLIASLKGCDPYGKERSTDPEMGPVYNFMLDLQELLVNWASENSAKLFGKKRSVESVRDSFKNLLSVSTEKQGDEYVPNGKYPPSLRLKVPVYDGRVTMDAVNSQMIPYHLTVDSLKSVFPKYVEANLVISPSVYVIGQGFGVTWGVKYAQVFPPSRLTAASVFSAVAELPSVPEESSEPPHEDDGVRVATMSHLPAQDSLAAAGGGGGGRRRKAA